MIEDFLYKFLDRYNNSSPFAKNLLGNIYKQVPLRLRYGRVYAHYEKLLTQSRLWKSEEIREYQNERLQNLVKHCYRNVPYYRAWFDRSNLKPGDFNGTDDLKRIPFLTKEIILQNRDELVAANYPKSKRLYYSTGGTTGNPMSFYNEKGVSRSKEFAFITNLWERVGYRIGDKLVTLRGNVIPSAKKNEFWEVEPIKNRLILSTYHMTEQNLEKYVEKIRAFVPDFIHTYPSAVTVLAKYMLERSLPPFKSLKAVLCSSEAFYPGQRELLQNAFQCRIFSWYGQGEMVALAGECEVSPLYHIYPEYGIVELVDENDHVIDRTGQMGEIVGTGFDRDLMPFLRYRTGDFAEYNDQPCTCGRNYRRLQRVEGRWLQEQVITRKGNLISVTALNMHTPVFRNVSRFQFYQEEAGKIELRLVPKNEFCQTDKENISSAFLKKFDSRDIDLIIKIVDDSQIDTGKSGKFRFLIQKLAMDNTKVEFSN